MCDPKTYTGIDASHRDMVISELRASGATVEGTNPYVVDTKKHGVKLRVAYDEAKQSAIVDITDSDALVPCGSIWGVIDPMVEKVKATKISNDPNVLALKNIEAAGGVFTPADRAAFKAALEAMDKPASPAAASAGGAGAAYMDWVKAHPYLAGGGAAALAYGAFRWLRK